jgi:hypothetical protein
MLSTCGDPAASSETEIDSLRGPENTGAKTTVTVQLALGAMVAVLQLPSELTKSKGLFPPAEILVTCIAAVPVLLMVTLMGTLASPCVVGGTTIGLGEKRRIELVVGAAVAAPIRFME